VYLLQVLLVEKQLQPSVVFLSRTKR
jgi:hypothetical protein